MKTATTYFVLHLVTIVWQVRRERRRVVLFIFCVGIVFCKASVGGCMAKYEPELPTFQSVRVEFY